MSAPLITIISSSYLANPETTKLGRLVLDPRDPDAPFCDSFPDQTQLFQSPEIGITVSPGVIDLAGTYNSQKKKSLSDALLTLLSGGTTASTIVKGNTLEGEVGLCRFDDSTKVLGKVCGQEDVQKFLGEYVVKSQQKVYMVVGYHTIRPLGEVAAGPGAESTTSLATFSSSGSQQSSASSLHEGAHVWGVQYRKVVCKLSRWDKEVKLKLKENQWKMPWSVRGQDNTIQNLVEANLDAAAADEFDLDPEDSDNEGEEPPESYFGTSKDSEEAEQFIFFNDNKSED